MPRSLFLISNRPFMLLTLVVMLLGAGFLPSPAAHAQGTDGMLPDPIADHDLTAYAQRLGLSEEQRLAIDAFHARYLEEFRRLREQEIDPYLEESAGILRRFMFAADSREVKRSLNELDRLISRIQSLDEALFNQIQTVLSDAQAQAMTGVRQMRQRERYRSGLVRFVGYANPGARIDLSPLLETMELTPPEREALAPIVSSYEDQLTGGLRNLHQATNNMYVKMVSEIEELNAGRDPRAGGRFRFGEQLREIMTEAGAGVMAEASRISALNLRYFRQFASLLSDDDADRLQSEYYQQAYPDVHRGMTECLRQYDAALHLPGLSDEQRSAIEAARQVLRDRHQRLADQMIDAWEDLRKTGMFFGGRGRRDDPARERLSKLQEEREALNERARESLLALLGSDLADELHRAQAEQTAPDESAPGAPASGATAPRRARPGGPRPGPPPRVDDAPAEPGALRAPDPFLPPPISEGEAQRLAERLQLDDDQRVILDVLHGDYRDAYEALRGRLIEPILDLSRTMWALDSDSQEIRPPSPDDIDRLFAMRREAFAGILALDESFFDNIGLAVVEDNDTSRSAVLARLRLMRQREAYNREAARVGSGFRRQGNRMFFGQSTPEDLEFRIDLTAIVEAQHLSGEDRDAIEPVLLDYERAALAAFKRRFELALDYGQATERLSAVVAARGRGPGSGMDRSVFEEFRRLRDTTGQELRDAEAAITELNRRTLQELLDVLPDAAGASVRTAYRREAYPDVYEDPTAAEGYFTAALALPNLAPAQRAQLNDILVEYRAAYAALCEQMADLKAEEARQADSNAPRDPGYWQERQERRTQLERLRFDRNDLNEKALRQLRAALSDDQLQRLGLVEVE
jgi:hypothetical protein